MKSEQVKAEVVTVSLNILGKEYRVACPKNKESDLLTAARQLEERMRRIRNSGRTVGVERIAVIAALNVTDELLQTQSQLTSVEAKAQDQLDQLMKRVDLALEDMNVT